MLRAHARGPGGIMGGIGMRPHSLLFPRGITTDGQRVYVADTGNDRVLRVMVDTGHYLQGKVPYGYAKAGVKRLSYVI